MYKSLSRSNNFNLSCSFNLPVRQSEYTGGLSTGAWELAIPEVAWELAVPEVAWEVAVPEVAWELALPEVAWEVAVPEGGDVLTEILVGPSQWVPPMVSLETQVLHVMFVPTIIVQSHNCNIRLKVSTSRRMMLRPIKIAASAYNLVPRITRQS